MGILDILILALALWLLWQGDKPENIRLFPTFKFEYDDKLFFLLVAVALAVFLLGFRE